MKNITSHDALTRTKRTYSIIWSADVKSCRITIGPFFACRTRWLSGSWRQVGHPAAKLGSKPVHCKQNDNHLNGAPQLACAVSYSAFGRSGRKATQIAIKQNPYHAQNFGAKGQRVRLRVETANVGPLHRRLDKVYGMVIWRRTFAVYRRWIKDRVISACLLMIGLNYSGPAKTVA